MLIRLTSLFLFILLISMSCSSDDDSTSEPVQITPPIRVNAEAIQVSGIRNFLGALCIGPDESLNPFIIIRPNVGSFPDAILDATGSACVDTDVCTYMIPVTFDFEVEYVMAIIDDNSDTMMDNEIEGFVEFNLSNQLEDLTNIDVDDIISNGIEFSARVINPDNIEHSVNLLFTGVDFEFE